MQRVVTRLPGQSHDEPNCQFLRVKHSPRKEVTEIGCRRAPLRRQKLDDFLRTVVVFFFCGPSSLPGGSLKRFDAQWVCLPPEGAELVPGPQGC